MSGRCDCGGTGAIPVADPREFEPCREHADPQALLLHDALALLLEALPSVEECEEFNKPRCRTRSKRIRAVLVRAEEMGF